MLTARVANPNISETHIVINSKNELNHSGIIAAYSISAETADEHCWNCWWVQVRFATSPYHSSWCTDHIVVIEIIILRYWVAKVVETIVSWYPQTVFLESDHSRFLFEIEQNRQFDPCNRKLNISSLLMRIHPISCKYLGFEEKLRTIGT